VYAIWGEDRAKVGRAVARLVARVTGEGGLPPERVEAAATPAAAVVASCDALSLAGLRLVIVDGADDWKADDAAPLVAYLASPNPGTCLALVSSGALTPSLARAVTQAGEELRFGPNPKASRSERAKWFAAHAVEEAKRVGTKLPAALARTLVARIGEDAPALTSEVEKLAAYAGSEPITREMLDEVVVAHPEARAYELADALTALDAPRAYALLHDLAGGDHPVAPIVIQATLARQYRGIAAAQGRGGAASAEQVSEASGLRGYPAQKALEQARSLPAGAGERAVARLAALELDLRVSELARLGRSPDDGQRLVLELAAHDLLAAARQGS
jgi:DNA polymerase III subunit delta